MERIKSDLELQYDAYETNILAHRKHETISPSAFQFIVELVLCVLLLPALIPVSIYAVMSLLFVKDRRDEQ